MRTEIKRMIEKALRANGFGQGTSKKIISIVARTLEDKPEEPAKGKCNADTHPGTKNALAGRVEPKKQEILQ